MRSHLTVDRERLTAFCRRNHIRKLSFFGSIMRDDFRSDSDVDVLVDFHPGQTPDFRIIDVERELGQLLGSRRVDMVSEKYLNSRLRQRVLGEAEIVYAEG
jgi:predicted nucleotidyltransferase